MAYNMRPRGAKTSTRRPDAATKLAKEAPERPPEGPKRSPGGPQEGPRGPKEASKEAPERPKSLKNLVFFNVFLLSSFLHQMGFGGLKLAPKRPK